MPEFHTSFFPDFTHVNFLFDAVCVTPTFEHDAPGLGAALADGIAAEEVRSTVARKMP